MNAEIKIVPLLPDSDFICFVIPALFTKAECEELLSPSIKNSFQKAISNYPTYYRNNDRLVFDSDVLAQQLFKKVKPYLPETIEINSSVQAENGTWVLNELNNRLRFCKYAAHQYFHRHLDGVYHRSATEQSKLTFMIYLNSAHAFEGGRTLFYKTKETEEIWASYIPQQGDLIVFDHTIWHEGEILTGGEKYVLRSDIIYRKKTSQSLTQPFSGHLGYIWKLLKFDEDTLLSGGRDKIINVWNKNGLLQQALSHHQNSILCLEKINSDTFISGSRDQRILVWHKNKEGLFELRNTMHIHSALVLSLARLSDHTFASGGGDTVVKISSLDGKVLRSLAEHSNWIWQVITLSDHYIATGSEDGTIKIWDTRTNHSLASLEEGSPVFCLAYNKDQRYLFSGNLKGEICIRSLSEDFQSQEVKRFAAHQGIIREIKLLNDRYFASCGEDNKVNVWDIETDRCVLQLEHQNFVQSLELLDPHTLLSASYDGTIKKAEWEVSNK